MTNYTTTGYAAVFNNIDSDYDILERGAFTKALKNCRKMPLVYAHDTDQTIGRILRAEEDAYGLFIHFQIFSAITKGAEVITLLKNKMRMGLSIGYRVRRSYSTSEKGGHVRHIQEAELVEISVTVKPANPLAVVRAKKK